MHARTSKSDEHGPDGRVIGVYAQPQAAVFEGVTGRGPFARTLQWKRGGGSGDRINEETRLREAHCGTGFSGDNVYRALFAVILGGRSLVLIEG